MGIVDDVSMGNLYRMRVQWGGTGVVGGGISTFYFASGATLANISPAVNTFFTAIKGNVPNTVTWTIPNGGDTLEDTTGELVGSWSSGGSFTVVATGTNQWASGVGGRFNWQTNTVINKRRLRGSTFICPMPNNLFDTDGTLNNTAVATMNTAAAAFIASTGVDFSIYHKPHPKGATNGEAHAVLSGTFPDKISWLRTRRT